MSFMAAKCCFAVTAIKLNREKVREDINLPEEMSLISGYIPEISTRIIKAMGGVPLAIEQARAMIKQGMPMQDLLEHYETHYQRVMEQKPPKSAWDYEKNMSLISVFNMLLTRLGEDSDAKNILAFASCFGPRKITVNLLVQARERSGRTELSRPSDSDLEDSPLTWLDYIGHNKLKLHLATSHLESLCLLKIKRDSDGAPVSIALHDSISRWRFATLKSDQREKWIIAAACALGPHLPKVGPGQGNQLQLLPLIRHFHKIIQRYIEPRKLNAPDGEHCHQYGRLMAHFAPLYLNSGHPLEGEYIFSQAIDYQRTMEGSFWPKDRKSLLLLKGLAMMLSKVGKLEDAAETTKALHHASTNILGPDDEITLWAAARFPAVRDRKVRNVENEQRATIASQGEKLTSAIPGHLSRPTSATPEHISMPTSDPPPYRIDDSLDSEINALVLAASKGDIEGIRLILERGARFIDGTAANPRNALQLASRNGHGAVVQMLLDYGADVNLQCGFLGTALHAASLYGHSAVVETLLCNGADVDAIDCEGRTSLCIAAFSGHYTVVQLLLIQGADVNLEMGNLGTALHIATGQGHTEVVEILLINGADINPSIPNIANPLILASSLGYASVVETLLSRGADVDIECFGKNALYMAALEGQYDIVRLLLQSGADANAEHEHEDTALQAAKLRGYNAVVDLLKAAGAREDV